MGRQVRGHGGEPGEGDWETGAPRDSHHFPPDLAEVITTDHDISTRSVGDMMSVSCAVASCVPDLTIQLLRGDLVQETRSLQQSEGSEFTSQEDGFAVTVDPSIVGEYSCRVVGTFMGETFAFSESFNITGIMGH